MSPRDIHAKHPMPWSYVTGPRGQIFVLDRNQAEVPLLTLLEFSCGMTQHLEPQMRSGAGEKGQNPG